MTKKVKLGDVATYINGYAFKPKDRGSKGLPIIRIQDLTGNSYDRGYYAGEYPEKIEINNGDILISWSASLGVYIWNRGKALLNQHIFKVVFDKLPINRNYFVYAVQYHLADMKQQTHGATMKHITKGVFEKLTIPYPDMQVQEEIAKRLNLIKNIQNKREIELKKLDDLIKARFVEMFGDPGTPGQRYPTDKLGNVAFVKSSHRVFTTEFVEKGIPFFRGTEIGILAEGGIPKDPFYITEKKYKELASDESKPLVGDLLMPSICNKGQVWMVDTEKPFYYKDGRVLCISPNRDIFDSKYLQFYLKLRTEIEYPKLGSGSTFAEFKIFQLKELEVDLPPKYMQERFKNFIMQVDKSKAVIQKSIDQTQMLFDSLMQEYFS